MKPAYADLTHIHTHTTVTVGLHDPISPVDVCHSEYVWAEGYSIYVYTETADRIRHMPLKSRNVCSKTTVGDLMHVFSTFSFCAKALMGQFIYPFLKFLSLTFMFYAIFPLSQPKVFNWLLCESKESHI